MAFTNESATSGPTSWAWDFDNNGTTDSTERSPAYTYAVAGTYSVKLTATNSLGSHALTRANYVTVTTPQPATFVPLAPARLLDTRTGNGLSGASVPTCPVRSSPGRGGVPRECHSAVTR